MPLIATLLACGPWLLRSSLNRSRPHALLDPAEVAAARFDRIEERARELLAAIR